MSPHAVVDLGEPVEARFLRFTVHSLQESKRLSESGLAVSEIDVATPDSPLTPTTLLPVPQSREWNYGGYNWLNRHWDLLAYTEIHRARLVFLGDSINHRWGAPPFDETPGTGQSVWQRYYGHRDALSLGYGWDRVENMLWRLQNGELSNTDPRLVVLMAGTNNFEVNSPSEIVSGVSAICEEIHRQKPDAVILLLAIFPRGASGTFPELQEANRLLAQLGERKHIEFRDIGSAFLTEEGELTRDVMPDLLHPSKEGYRRWARAIEEDVARILGDAPVTD
jgi:beta-glucosidase